MAARGGAAGVVVVRARGCVWMCVCRVMVCVMARNSVLGHVWCVLGCTCVCVCVCVVVF